MISEKGETLKLRNHWSELDLESQIHNIRCRQS